MSGIATHAIKGFLYQFNKTILEILKSKPGNSVVVEGPVEDIHVETIMASGQVAVSAIQCKYHECASKFSVSAFYKPLLQMMAHYATDPQNFTYVLFAHFPNADETTVDITVEDLKNALASTNKQLASLIEQAKKLTDLSAFLKVFRFEVGQSYDDLLRSVHAGLVNSGIPDADIEALAYPVALEKIAAMSTRSNANLRKITRSEFITHLKTAKSVVITAWTLSAYGKRRWLDALKKQIKPQMSQNSRNRAFVIDAATLPDFENRISLLIELYIPKFFSKQAHLHPPTFALAVDSKQIDALQAALYEKGILVNDGYVASEFKEKHFTRKPVRTRSECSFHLRLMRWPEHQSALAALSLDDCYLVGDKSDLVVEAVFAKAERISVKLLRDFEYVLGVSNVFG